MSKNPNPGLPPSESPWKTPTDNVNHPKHNEQPPEIVCDACQEPFTASEWVNRHTPGLLSLHVECCDTEACSQ